MSDYSDDYEWEDDGLNYDHGFAPCESCGSTAEVCLCDTSYNGVFDDMSADVDDEDESERLVLADDPVTFYAGVDEDMRKHAGVEVEPMEYLDLGWGKSPVERAHMNPQPFADYVTRNGAVLGVHFIDPDSPEAPDPEIEKFLDSHDFSGCMGKWYIQREVPEPPPSSGDECDCGCQE